MSKDLYLLRLSVSKDALIPRETMDTIQGCKRTPRALSDSVRLALTDVLRPWQKFLGQGGVLCKALVASPQGAGRNSGMETYVHVQRRGKAVDYSQAVACIKVDRKGGVVVEEGPEAREFPTLWRALDADKLRQLGENHYFEGDIRRACQTILAEKAVALWPGVFLAETQEAATNIRLILGNLTQGNGGLRSLLLSPGEDTLQALLQELSDGFLAEAQDLLDRTTYPAPNVKGIRKDYDALQGRILQAEKLLGIPALQDDALEMLLMAEDALSVLEAS